MTRADSLIAGYLTEVSHEKLARRLAGKYDLRRAPDRTKPIAMLPGASSEAASAFEQITGRPLVTIKRKASKLTDGPRFLQTHGNCLDIAMGIAAEHGLRPSIHPKIASEVDAENVRRKVKKMPFLHKYVNRAGNAIAKRHLDRLSLADEISRVPRHQLQDYMDNNGPEVDRILSPESHHGEHEVQAAKDSPSSRILSVTRAAKFRGLPSGMTSRDILSGRSIASGVASHLAVEAGKHSYPKPAPGDTGKHTGHYLVIRGKISRGRDGAHAVRALHVAYEHPKRGEMNFGVHSATHPILGRIPLVHE